jgi:arabinan endo-1,5-alpha-L-arabinosidase
MGAIIRFRAAVVATLAMAAIFGVTTAEAAPTGHATGTYSNPLTLRIPGDGLAESCADPTVIHGQQPGDRYWYLYCTKDPLNDEDRNPGGGFNFHNIPTFRSLDLVSWTYTGDAFGAVPAWGEPTSGMWAPEIDYFNGRYYLYYTMTDPKPEVSGAPDCDFDPAIGVATSVSPTGPWTDLGRPVIEPRYNGAPRDFGERECNFLWTFDPEVIQAASEGGTGQRYLYYGSYYGGIQVRELSTDGFSAPAATAVQVTIANRYEGAEVVFRSGYYYLFASSSNCCNGPVTGYSVYAGRSRSPLGPFVDKHGNSLLAGRVGSTPVLSMNGNRWVGPGHNTVFTDFEGHDWTIYHAVNRDDPYFAGTTDFTKRPALLDAVDWVDGWPMVRGGRWVSDTPQHAPAAQPGDKSAYRLRLVQEDELGPLLPEFSDEFDSRTLSPDWTWIREPAAGSYALEDGTFRFDTQAGDLYQDVNSASVLTRPAPNGNYVVETRVKLNLPAEGCCFNFVQAGIVIYGDDDRYVRLTHVSIWETRQTEFGKEFIDPFRHSAHFGGTLVGTPAEWTYLRIVKRAHGGFEYYTAYTSQDVRTWVRGGTWAHRLGQGARIGLVSMGGTGFVAHFDYVRVYRLHR